MKYQRIIQHGHSLAVVIPVAICRELKIHRGDNVRLKVVTNETEVAGWGLCFLEIRPIKENNK